MNFYEWFFLEKGRAPAGLFSFDHLFSVTLTLLIFLSLAVFLGRKFKNDEKKKQLVLLISGISIVTLQVAKITYLLIQTDNIVDCLIGNAPLYFCDIMIFIIPLAAITKGRFREWCLDFVAICGLLMGFMGNYFAGNLYPSHAVISWAAMVALLNHSISAFVSLFVWCSKLNKMEKKNIPFVIGLLFVFMTIALVMAYAFEKNFMFFFSGDGTPFTIFYDLVKGNVVPYQIIIYILQCGYIGVFYALYYPITASIKRRNEAHQAQKAATENE
ncbi:MAG: YwaF family protein [Bacilli bacterium]|nr:YwaF family protein [Bacilli bacterium]